MIAEQLPLPAPTPPVEYTARYTAFARSQGRTPDEQFAHDRRDRPEGNAIPFSQWVHARWREYRAANGMRREDPAGPHQDAFDAWLEGITR